MTASERSITDESAAERMTGALGRDRRVARPVTIVPVHVELTTQQAADLVNVSRPHLVGLLERTKLPHCMVGARRRIKAVDLFAYKQREEDQRKKVLDELTAEAEKHGLGY